MNKEEFVKAILDSAEEKAGNVHSTQCLRLNYDLELFAYNPQIAIKIVKKHFKRIWKYFQKYCSHSFKAYDMYDSPKLIMTGYLPNNKSALDEYILNQIEKFFDDHSHFDYDPVNDRLDDFIEVDIKEVVITFDIIDNIPAYEAIGRYKGTKKTLGMLKGTIESYYTKKKQTKLLPQPAVNQTKQQELININSNDLIYTKRIVLLIYESLNGVCFSVTYDEFERHFIDNQTPYNKIVWLKGLADIKGLFQWLYNEKIIKNENRTKLIISHFFDKSKDTDFKEKSLGSLGNAKIKYEQIIENRGKHIFSNLFKAISTLPVSTNH